MKTYYIIIAVLAVIVLLLGIRFYLKHKKPTVQTYEKSGIDIQLLVDSLGGKENIKSVESSLSKVTVELLSKKDLNIEQIKSLGATGIVQNQNKLSMIFGKVSETVSKEIKDKI